MTRRGLRLGRLRRTRSEERVLEVEGAARVVGLGVEEGRDGKVELRDLFKRCM